MDWKLADLPKHDVTDVRNAGNTSSARGAREIMKRTTSLRRRCTIIFIITNKNCVPPFLSSPFLPFARARKRASTHSHMILPLARAHARPPTAPPHAARPQPSHTNHTTHKYLFHDAVFRCHVRHYLT